MFWTYCFFGVEAFFLLIYGGRELARALEFTEATKGCGTIGLTAAAAGVYFYFRVYMAAPWVAWLAALWVVMKLPADIRLLRSCPVEATRERRAIVVQCVIDLLLFGGVAVLSFIDTAQKGVH